MKKTLDINIRGTVFHIDEDAYEKLNKYLSEISRHFKSKKGHEDIINDIENRIVELFQQKLTDKKQVINFADVEEVIGIMGHPSDFDQDSEEEANPSVDTKRKDRRDFSVILKTGLSAVFVQDLVHILTWICCGSVSLLSFQFLLAEPVHWFILFYG